MLYYGAGSLIRRLTGKFVLQNFDMIRRIFRIALLCFVLAGIGTVQAQEKEPSFAGQMPVNGTELYVKVFGEGDPILVIHGGPGISHGYFLPHLLPLAQHHKVVFYDQRSTGLSQAAEQIPQLSLENMLRDIKALKDSLHLDKVNILAHSWGARLALNYALTYPGDVKSLVLVSPIALNHDFDSVQMASVQTKSKQKDLERQEEIMNSEVFKNGDPKAYEELLKLNFKTSFFNADSMSKLNLDVAENVAEAGKLLMMGLRADMENYSKDMYASLKGIKAPVLILHGNADNIPLKADEKLKASIPGASLVIFERSGHFPFIEENEKFVKTVSAFIKPEVKKK